MTVFVMFLLGITAHSNAAYKWIDEQGQVHYSDEPPNGPCEELKTPKCPSEEDIQGMQERLEHQRRLLREFNAKKRHGTERNRTRKTTGKAATGKKGKAV